MLNMTSSDLFFTKQLELKYILTKMLFVGKSKGLKPFVKGIEVLTYNFVITLKRDKVLLRRLRGSTNIDLVALLWDLHLELAICLNWFLHPL